MYTKIGFVFTLCLIASVKASSKDIDIEKDITNFINEIDNEKSLPLFGGLTVDRIENGRSFGSVHNHQTKSESLFDRTERYLQTHELNFSFDAADENSVDSSSTGRSIQDSRSKKVKKMLVPLLLALKLKMALVMKVMLLLVKFISLKALAIGFLALIISGSQLFKDLLAKKQDHVTTAYIAGAPAAEIVHSDWHRSGQAAAQDLAYNHYAGAQPVY
ncbi:uncharacterized protein LOC129613145 [Condylostylus longicornis]|uniref:uncharacterized protein LOC129613145 n=1 Tax=Condylostylus longicornis TaxID=2530218 RepID=UPI00244E17E4|nr:uncharacterized protein LOC129613145 [Condylostylus longicornis]